MKSNKEYRFSDNPQEKIFHDKFIEMFTGTTSAKRTLSSIIFGWSNSAQTIPNSDLTSGEEDICLNIIQWLGSPIGISFLRECGFEQVPPKIKKI